MMVLSKEAGFCKMSRREEKRRCRGLEEAAFVGVAKLALQASDVRCPLPVLVHSLVQPFVVAGLR